MKTKFIGSMSLIGALSSPLISISFISNSKKIKEWKAFLKDVNSIDSFNMDRTLNNLLTQKEFFAKYSSWNNLTITELNSRIHDLFSNKKSGFSYDEKVYIARLLINSFSFEHAFENWGFHNNLAASDKESKTEYLINPINSQPIIENGKKIKTVGITRFVKDWKTNFAYDKVFEISNQDNIKNILWLISKDPHFIEAKNLIKKGGKLKDVLSTFFIYTNMALKSIFKTKLIDPILYQDMFSLLKGMSLDKYKNDEEVYEAVLKSDFGKYIFGSNLKNKEEDILNYKNDVNEREFLNMEIFHNIALEMNKISNVKGMFENYYEDNIKNLDKKQKDHFSKMIAHIIRLTLNESNNLSKPIFLRISGSLFQNYRIKISNNIDPLKWKQILNNYLIAGLVIGSSEFDYDWRYYKEYKNLPINNHIWNKIYENEYNDSLSKKSKDDTLVVNPGGVMYAGDNSWYNIYINIETTNQIYSLPKWYMRVHENDHDSNSSIKNVESYISGYTPSHEVCSTGPYPVVPTCVENGHNPIYSKRTVPLVINWNVHVDKTNNDFIKNAWTNFRWNEGKKIKDKKMFTQLKDALNSSINRMRKKIEAEILRIKNNKEHIDNFNPMSNMIYSYDLYIKSIRFSELRFNTYDDSGWDDTHSDNFRFTDVTANYSYSIKTKEL